MVHAAAHTWFRVRRYLDHDLWVSRGPISRLPIRFARHLLRLVVVVVHASRDSLLNLEAMGLVYTTLLSLVPFLAVTFSVLKAFGAHYRMEPVLAQMLEPLGSKGSEVTSRVIGFVSNMHVGVLGAVGVAGLFYTVVSLIDRIEGALNRIWRVRQARGLRRKFSDYLSILLVGPVLVLAAFAIIAAARSHWLLQRVLEVTGLEAAWLAMARNVTPLLLLAAAFTFLYRFLPYARVSLRAAAVGGLTAAVLWHLAGVGFAALVASSTSYAAIYSSFAVLILSLIWLHAAWLIVLIGGQVAYVHQHPASYGVARRRPCLSYREQIGLTALGEIAAHHLSGRRPYRVDDLAAALEAPAVTVEELVEDFIARGLLARGTDPEGLLLARAAERISIVEVLSIIRDPGPVGAPATGAVARRATEMLARRDHAEREALAGLTLRSLAGEPGSAEAAVADLLEYRRRSG